MTRSYADSSMWCAAPTLSYRCGLQVSTMTWPSPPTASNTAPILISRSGSVKPSASSMTTGTLSSLATKRRPGQPGDDAQLLLRAAGQRLVWHGAPRQRAAADPQLAVDLDLEGVAEDDAAQPLHLVAERVDVAQPGGVAMPGHHRAQQLRGPRPPMHPQVFGLGVLAFGLGGVELALASLGAVHLQLRGHQAQSVGDLVVAVAQRVDAAQRLIEGGGDGIRCAAGELAAEVRDEPGGPARLFHVGLGLDEKFVVGCGGPLLREPVPPDGQLGVARGPLLPRDAGLGRPLPQSFCRGLGDLAVRLAVGDGLLLCGGGLVEFGARSCRIGLGRPRRRAAVGRRARSSASRARSASTSSSPIEAVGGRGRPVAGADQFPAPLIEDARARDIIDPAAASASVRTCCAASSLAWVSDAGAPGTTRAVSTPGTSISVGRGGARPTRCRRLAA